MRHIGQKGQGDTLVVSTRPVPPLPAGETWSNRAKYEIIGIGPDFYGTVAGDILEFEDGRLRAAVTIGAWTEGTYLVRTSHLGADGWSSEESLLTITHPSTDDPREGPETALAPFLKEAFATGTIPDASRSIAFTYEVQGDELVIRPVEPLEPNHTYEVYVGPGTVLAGGKALGAWVRSGFDTTLSPLYVTRSELSRELGLFGQRVGERKMLAAIRLAGLKAHQLQRLPTNVYDASTFETVEEEADNYYATTRFVLYEALLRCGETLYGEMLYGTDGLGGAVTGSYAIGDLQVQGSRDDQAGKVAEEMKMLNRRLSGWEGERAYWQDAMLNRNARGYARAQNAAYRSGAGSPGDRTV